MPLFIPLYDQENGGLPSAWKCLSPQCNRLTKTKRGMLIHMRLVHGIRLQMDFDWRVSVSSSNSTTASAASTKTESA